MSVKIKVRDSSRSVRLVATGEKTPVIIPNSVVLGIDTVGSYVAKVDAGQGIVITTSAGTGGESANLVISHASTTTEISSTNGFLEFTRNIDLDQFGHITALYNTSFNSNNFIANSTVISAQDIILGNTSITLGETTDVLSGLNLTDVVGVSGINGIVDFNDNILSNVLEPVNPRDVVNKQWLDIELERVENTVKVLQDPVLPTDGANKRYVDNLIQGLVVRPAALAATTSDLGAVFDSGNTTFSSTLTLPPTSILYIDDVTSWEVGYNVLVKDQNDPRQNGSYDLVQKGSANTEWVFQRTEWSNESSELPGSFEFVIDGTINSGTGWVATVADASTFQVNVHAITWSQFSGEGTFTAGAGIDLVGNQFSIKNAIPITQIDPIGGTLTVSGTGAIAVPTGNSLTRPSPILGMIRFNSQTTRFEGYDGIAWSSLGGISDSDQNTYITAEDTLGANNNELKFYTDGTLAAKFTANNNSYFYGDVDVVGNLTIGGNLTLGNANTDSISVVADFTSNLIPDTDRTFDLGSQSKNWNNLFVDTIRSSDEVLTLNVTGALKLPSANTGLRPTPIAGMIRFNAEDSQFEGYDGIAWSGLGGVIDVDQNTKITAEDSPGLNNNELKFYTDGTLAAKIDSANNAYFYGDANFQGGINITEVISNLVPDQDRTRNIGSEAKNWNVLNVDTIRSSDEIVKFDTTGALLLPSANTALRPIGQQGMLRFNSDEARFEGFDGNIWSGLAGSVIDLDRNTYIIAETSAGANNNDLDFWTDGIHRMQIDQDGALRYGNNLDKLIIYYNTGEVVVNGKVTSEDILVLDSNNYISASNNTITDVADPVNPSDVVTLNYLENSFQSNLKIVDNANTYATDIDLLQAPTLEIGRGLELQSISSANNAFKIGLDAPMSGSTGVYGNDGFIPRIRITEDGRIDFATEIAVELQANAIPDFTETSRDIIGLMFTDGLHEGITVFNDDANDRMNLLVNNFNITLNGDVSGTATVTRNSNTTITASLAVDFISNLIPTANGGIIVTHTPGPNSNAAIEVDFDYLDTQYITTSGGTSTGDIIAPRFVDYNNSIYYMDPSSISRINSMEVGYGSTFSQIKMRDGAGSFSYLYSSSGKIGFLDNTFNYAMYSERSTGDLYVPNGDVRAERFIDHDAPTYFLHPGGTDTYIKQITVQDKIIASSIAIGGDVGIRTIKTTTGILVVDGSDGISLQGNGNDLNVNSSKITNLLNPTSAQDAATKSYVDGVAQGLKILPAALAATTTTLAATYTGTSLTANVNGAFTLDGVTSWSIGDQVLVKNQTNPSRNGSYELTTLGDGSTPWVLTRGEYFNQSAEIPGSFQFVIDGATNAGTGWVATVADAETFELGVDAVIWYQFSGAGTYTAGESLTLTGNQFSITDGDIENIKLANPQIVISGEAGANTVIALGDTLIIEGTDGVDTTVTSGKISIAVNIIDGGTF